MPEGPPTLHTSGVRRDVTTPPDARAHAVWQRLSNKFLEVGRAAGLGRQSQQLVANELRNSAADRTLPQAVPALRAATGPARRALDSALRAIEGSPEHERPAAAWGAVQDLAEGGMVADFFGDQPGRRHGEGGGRPRSRGGRSARPRWRRRGCPPTGAVPVPGSRPGGCRVRVRRCCGKRVRRRCSRRRPQPPGDRSREGPPRRAGQGRSDRSEPGEPKARHRSWHPRCIADRRAVQSVHLDARCSGFSRNDRRRPRQRQPPRPCR